VLAQVNREVAFCDQDNKGYTLLTLTPDRASAEFVAVSTVLAKPFERRVVATYATGAGTQRGPLAPVSS
jgi:alkaline phosphatase D